MATKGRPASPGKPQGKPGRTEPANQPRGPGKGVRPPSPPTPDEK
jgi:hypothetical protein